MGNETNDNLYVPPKLEDTLSINAEPQQGVMEQPQNLNMDPQNLNMDPQNLNMGPQNLNIGQQNLNMGPQNLNIGQQQDLLMGQPQQVEEKQDLEDKPFNITDFLNEKAWKPPTVEELIKEKLAEVKQPEKVEEVKQEQLSREKTEEEEEAELEEAERIKYEAKQLNMTVEEYHLAKDQQERQEEQKQELRKDNVSKAGKVKFEKGINSKPGRCEKLSQNSSMKKAKKRINCRLGVTQHTNKLLDQFGAGRAKAISQNEAATLEMRPISEKRVAIEKEQRNTKLQKQKEKEEKERKANKGKDVDVPLKAETLKPIEEGFNQNEKILIELAEFMPISKTSTVLSDNPATCALGLKSLVDKAVSYDVSANMICSVALTKNLADLKQLVLNIPMISKLLENNPDAAALLDKQKLKMFENVNRMIPDLKTGMEQGLRLNGLDIMGGGYYENKPNVDVEADKKEAMFQWSQASNNLHALDLERQEDIGSYAEYTQESWEKHKAFQLQTKKPTISRFEVDASANVLVSGMSDYKERHNKTMGMVVKSKGLASGKESYLEMIAGTAPINATQEQMDAHVESFKPENAEATVKALVHDFLRTPLASKNIVAESAQDRDMLKELMQLKDKLTAISALPEHFRGIFEDKEFEAQKAAKKARGKLPAGEKEPKLKDQSRKFRHLLGSAQQAAKAIDTQIEFLLLLHNAKPDQIDAMEQMKYSAGYKASQDIYKTFVDGITKGEGAAKLKDW